MTANDIQPGKKYLSVRCNSVDCDNLLIYAGLPDKFDPDMQDNLEQQHGGELVDCPCCRRQTRVYEGLAVFIR